MKKLKVEFSSDWNNCETCGGGVGYGITATLEGEAILDVPAVGSCYNGLGEEDCWKMLFEKLGYDLEDLV
jgi:hypothetical protein